MLVYHSYQHFDCQIEHKTEYIFKLQFISKTILIRTLSKWQFELNFSYKGDLFMREILKTLETSAQDN